MSLFRRLFSKPDLQAEDVADLSGDSVTKTEPDETTIETIAPDEVVVDKAPPTPPAISSSPDGTTRPLPPEAVISSQNEHITFGQSTDVGMVRNNNQDASLSMFFTNRSADPRPDFGLFVLADGMGGHHDGEKASAMSTSVIASQVTNKIYLPMITKGTAEHLPVTEFMISAVQKANAEVNSKVPEGGTTVSAVVVIGNLAHIVHVGDSRIYLISKEGIEQITRDHSLVQRLIELDQLTPEEVADHPQKNVLYRAIGQSETVEVDTLIRRLPPNSRLLLCSDGLWGQVEDKEIYDIVTSHPNPQEACDKLVALANTRGGLDNITTILLKTPSN